DAELQPIQALRITAEIGRRLYVLPTCVAVPVPDTSDLLRTLVTPAQPFPQFAPGRVAIAIHLPRAAAVVRVLVPQIVAQQSRMVPIMFHQRDQKLLGCGANIRIIEAETGEPSGGAAAPDTAGGHAAVARQIACVRILPEGPFGRIGDELGDDYLDSVLRSQVHHA